MHFNKINVTRNDVSQPAMDTEGAWRQHLYLQTRLKEKNGRIRLLTIQSRQYTASRTEAPPNTIHCFLRLAILKEHPQFTVVSHRWQATDAIDESRSVLVNGAAVPVSAGLFEVLHHLQREAEPVVVWIDALCINHADADETEKSVQVAQLAQIFAAAEKTFIWLGATADRSDEAMKVLRRLAEEQLTLSAYVANWTPQLGHQLVQKILPSRFVNAAAPVGSGSNNKEPLELQKELEALRAPLKALMERAYWTHLWSLVELCMSARGLVVCGPHGLALDHFYSAARALDHIINHLTYSKWLASANPSTSSTTPHLTSPPSSSAVVLRSEEVSNLSRSPALRVLARREDHRRDAAGSWLKAPDTPLFALLSRFYAVPLDANTAEAEAESQVSFLRVDDPRERVYALACLATDVEELGLTVDYGRSVGEVFAETSAAFLRKQPRVLQLARGTAGAGEGEGEGEGLTSWAVDWEAVRLPPSYLGPAPERPFNACGPADVRYYRADTSTPGQVALKAGVVDRVAEVGTTYELSADGGDEDKGEEEEDGEKEKEKEKGDGVGVLGNAEKQRAYLVEIARFWEDSTASLSSPYFAEQAAVALAKIPVGDIEVSDILAPAGSLPGGIARASSATIEGYKKTVAALLPSAENSPADTESPIPVEIPTKEEEEEGEEQKQEKGQGEGETTTINNIETTNTKPPNPGPSLPYLAAMARMAGRKPFRSLGGYVGLGPADLAVDDVVAIPYGAPVPFAFRRRGGDEDDANACYRLVGEVYVFGIMDGEFMKVHRQETVLRVV